MRLTTYEEEAVYLVVESGMEISLDSGKVPGFSRAREALHAEIT